MKSNTSTVHRTALTAATLLLAGLDLTASPSVAPFRNPINTGPRWYLYCTADDGTDSHHRMYVPESAGHDPLGPQAFKGKPATDPKDEFYAIGGSVLRKRNGELYFRWAGYPGHRLFIARMANPWTAMGPRTLIPADGFGCEEVREGPFALVRNGRIFLIYSACDTGKPDCKLGMVTAQESADALDAKSWIQHAAPIFQRADANGVYGPGHRSFFKSPDGKEDWILYHGKTAADYTYAGRTTRAQKFAWKPDGTPDFGTRLPTLRLDAMGRVLREGWENGNGETGEKKNPGGPGYSCTESLSSVITSGSARTRAFALHYQRKCANAGFRPEATT